MGEDGMRESWRGRERRGEIGSGESGEGNRERERENYEMESIQTKASGFHPSSRWGNAINHYKTIALHLGAEFHLTLKTIPKTNLSLNLRQKKWRNPIRAQRENGHETRESTKNVVYTSRQFYR